MNHEMTTTAFTIDGYRVVKPLGIVRGITVRSRSIFGTIGVPPDPDRRQHHALHRALRKDREEASSSLQHAEDGRQRGHRRALRRATRSWTGDRGALLRYRGHRRTRALSGGPGRRAEPLAIVLLPGLEGTGLLFRRFLAATPTVRATSPAPAPSGTDGVRRARRAHGLEAPLGSTLRAARRILRRAARARDRAAPPAWAHGGRALCHLRCPAVLVVAPHLRPGLAVHRAAAEPGISLGARRPAREL